MFEFIKKYPSESLVTTAVVVTLGAVTGLSAERDNSDTDMEFFRPRQESVVKAPAKVGMNDDAHPKIILQGSNSTPSDNEPINGYSDPLVQSAMKLYDEFSDLPYVWGGESPKDYGDTIDDPFFDRFEDQVTKRQPLGNFRSGKQTEPGFDCSGFVWYAGRKANIEPFNSIRASAHGYFKRGDKVLEPGNHSNKELGKYAKEGDLFFTFNKKGRAKHVAICIGNGKILESSGIEKPDYDSIPQSEWKRWGDKYNKPDRYRGGIQISDIGKYRNEVTAICSY